MATFKRLISRNISNRFNILNKYNMISTQKWFKSERVHVLASFDVKQDKINEFLDAVRPCIDLTNKEDGCITYNLHKDSNDNNKFVMIEEWESRSHLDAHLETDHVKQLLNNLNDVTVTDAVVSIYGEPLVQLKDKQQNTK